MKNSKKQNDQDSEKQHGDFIANEDEAMDALDIALGNMNIEVE